MNTRSRTAREARAVATVEKRVYRSALRKQQMEQTRELIVEALADQVWQEGLADFSVPKVAKRAGVSTRTVYRYFPTRDDLLDAVGEWIRAHAPEPEPPRDPGDIVRYARELYAYFEAHPQLVDLQTLPGLGREVQERERAKRLARTHEVLAKWMPDVEDERERLRRFAPVRVLLGSRTWQQMTRELGFTTAEAADIVCETIETLERAQRRGGRNARR